MLRTSGSTLSACLELPMLPDDHADRPRDATFARASLFTIAVEHLGTQPREPKAESRTKREEGPGGGLLRWESREGSGTSPGTARASSCPKRDRVTSAFRATAVRPIRFPRLLFALIPRDHRIHEADRDPTVTYVRPRRPRIPQSERSSNPCLHLERGLTQVLTDPGLSRAIRSRRSGC